jgi:hypothetical protein
VPKQKSAAKKPNKTTANLAAGKQKTQSAIKQRTPQNRKTG